MSEMSLVEQIKAVEDLIQYVEKTLPNDIKSIQSEAEDAMRFFRQNGRTEIAAQIDVYMRGIDSSLSYYHADGLMCRLKNGNLDYLYGVREHLLRALNEK